MLITGSWEILDTLEEKCVRDEEDEDYEKAKEEVK